MSHDYASKNSPRKRGATKASPSKAPPPKKRGLPWALILSALILGGFGYGLYRLAGVSPDPQVTQQALQTKPPVAAAPAPKRREPAADGAAQDEGYRFYTLLPESEVVPPKVEAYNSTPREQTDYSQYQLQAGSFRSEADADSLRAKLLLKGLPNVTTSRVASTDGSLWYRVRVGPFDSRSKLNKAQDTLVRMNLRPLQVKVPQG